ncbi:uncharacterized protein LOC135461520 [Liolophura sinensis]|uniref:uncharacterized protein LOC135461520 n=1 Tax=Liolophura sinensis TaxID=3198878 RepID=UPI003158CD1F
MEHIITGLLFAGLLFGCSSGCSLPNYLIGDWESSDVGTLTFNDTAFGPYTVGSFGDYYFECYSQLEQNTLSGPRKPKYILTADQYFYLCLDLRYQSNNKYIYYLHTSQENAASNQRVKIVQASTTPSGICDDIRPEHTYFMLLKVGTESSEKVVCPSWFLTSFNYTATGSTCPSTSGTTCNDNAIVSYNTTLCNLPLLLSQEGSLGCMYHKSIGSTNYLTLYNYDTVPIYKFVCMVSNTTGSIIQATREPNVCGDSQTPVGSIQLELEILNTCPIVTTTLAPVKNSAHRVPSAISLLACLACLAMTRRY